MAGKQRARLGTVVENQPFDIGVALLLDAAQALREEFLTAEGRSDDADERSQ